MYFLGVDGGGTKTSFTLIDYNGKVKSEVIKGPSHPTQIGFENLEKLLKEGLEDTIKNNNISRNHIERACLGLAGYGIVKEIAEKIAEVVERVFEGIDYDLNSDVRVAIAGALAGEDGINIVAGTGSIALALKSDELIRCGGWGYTVGDEASAYWIGKKAIALFSKESDGRVEKGPLYEIIKTSLGLNRDAEIISYINNEIKGDRSEIAKLAILCSEAARIGDKGAIVIFNQAAFEIAEMIKTLLKNYDNNHVKVSYTGGVFKSGYLILEPLKNMLEGLNVELIEPVLSPDLGACLLAYISSGNKITNTFIKNLSLSEN
ncbi:BadF/BadG/BcrA/BcrD ATPase family protein [Clostridium sp. AL.422]|uniref:N-acetylglucosamine kinase n=1 Tax=Clostridium TaxID=1485 RepID=UPI00293DA896|nr:MULTISPECIES: BadF/BadG/BcrA/BcrD ATPase family protein [unclassified Clostridium]MDV4150690.1 BadF/BadG/BcrA/BcrD ATPase family protein [Clostridium sp. AL.422]